MGQQIGRVRVRPYRRRLVHITMDSPTSSFFQQLVDLDLGSPRSAVARLLNHFDLARLGECVNIYPAVAVPRSFSVFISLQSSERKIRAQYSLLRVWTYPASRTVFHRNSIYLVMVNAGNTDRQTLHRSVRNNTPVHARVMPLTIKGTAVQLIFSRVISALPEGCRMLSAVYCRLPVPGLSRWIVA